MQRPAAGSAGPRCHSPRPPGVRGKGAEAPPQSLRFGLASAARPSSSWQTSLRRFCQPRPWSETCSRWTAGLRLPSPFFSALCSPFPPSKYRHFPYSRSSSGCVATGTRGPFLPLLLFDGTPESAHPVNPSHRNFGIHPPSALQLDDTPIPVSRSML